MRVINRLKGDRSIAAIVPAATTLIVFLVAVTFAGTHLGLLGLVPALLVCNSL